MKGGGEGERKSGRRERVEQGHHVVYITVYTCQFHFKIYM